MFSLHQKPHISLPTVQPEAENFAVLLRNTADNPNVHVLKAALWKSDASLVVEHGLDDFAWVSTLTGLSALLPSRQQTC